MVTRVNGAPRQGVWFSADVRFLTITATGGTFLADLTVAGEADAVNTGLEQVLEAVATRGTVIGLSVVSATVANVIVDYAQAYDAAELGSGPVPAATVIEEVEAAINAIATPDLSGADVAVFQGFAGAALGTPA